MFMIAGKPIDYTAQLNGCPINLISLPGNIFEGIFDFELFFSSYCALLCFTLPSKCVEDILVVSYDVLKFAVTTHGTFLVKVRTTSSTIPTFCYFNGRRRLRQSAKTYIIDPMSVQYNTTAI